MTIMKWISGVWEDMHERNITELNGDWFKSSTRRITENLENITPITTLLVNLLGMSGMCGNRTIPYYNIVTITGRRILVEDLSTIVSFELK